MFEEQLKEVKSWNVPDGKDEAKRKSLFSYTTESPVRFVTVLVPYDASDNAARIAEAFVIEENEETIAVSMKTATCARSGFVQVHIGTGDWWQWDVKR